MLSTMALSRPVWSGLPASAPMCHSFQVVEPDDPDRAPVERFVQEVFRRHHGAQVRRFTPVLVAMRNARGELVAAAGYRCAADGPLFLERYLNGPVEALLDVEDASAVSRHSIVEVGHLVANEAGQGRRLILQLGAYLAGQRYQWVVATLTQELRHLFTRLGIQATPLAPARAEVLGSDAADWGHYYEHSPMVFAGRVDGPRRF